MDIAVRQNIMKYDLCGQMTDVDQDTKYTTHKLCIEYLQSILQDGLLNDKEEIGFCYWKISDKYAMMREGELQFHNHNLFYEHLNLMPSIYMYWAVCDATQKMNLEEFGKSFFWWNIYREANETNKEIQGFESIVFEAHRAALTPSPYFQNHEFQWYAKDCFESFLQQTVNSRSHNYYELIYGGLCLRAFGSCECDIEALCYVFLEDLRYPQISPDYILGEWQGFTEDNNDVARKARVGICSAVNSWIYVGKNEKAKRIYYKAREYGLPMNAYIEKRL